MSFADYIAGMETGLIKTLFTLLNKFMTICTLVASYFEVTLREVIIDCLQLFDLEELFIEAVNAVLMGDWAFIYNVTIGDLILGSALMFVIVFGILKYFTDIIF